MRSHQRTVREVLGRFPEGTEVETAGDSFLLVFTAPSAAVRFALALRAAQRLETDEPPLRDRFALHQGEVIVDVGPGGRMSLHGMVVDVTARILGLAEAHRVLLTEPVHASAEPLLRDLRLRWIDHGTYALKGQPGQLGVREVAEEGDGPCPPPPGYEKARPVLPGVDWTWRPAPGARVPGTAFRAQAPLGAGVGGSVWRCIDEAVGLPRVLKFCYDPAQTQALRREVAIFGRLGPDARGIHPILHASLDAPPCFVVSELAEGGDLADGAAALTLPERLDALVQVADALQVAHEAGILHRDVKPANILLVGHAGARSAHLADFGFSTWSAGKTVEAIAFSARTRDALDTSPTAVFGSAPWLAPEVVGGEPATVQSDVYALGVVLYQLLCGDMRRPPPTDWRQVLRAAPGLDPEDVPLLAEDVAGALAGSPADRTPSAAALAASIRAMPMRRRHAQRRRWRHAAAGVVAAALSLLALVGFVREWQDWRTETEDQARTHVATGGRYEDAGDIFGALLYYVAALEHTPDGAILEGRKLRVARILGAAPRLVAAVPFDGDLVGIDAAGLGVAKRRADGSVVRVDLDGEAGTMLTHPVAEPASASDVPSETQGIDQATPLGAGGVDAAAPGDDERWTVRAASEGGVKVWDEARSVAVSPLLAGFAAVRTAALASSGRRVAILRVDRHLELWDLGPARVPVGCRRPDPTRGTTRMDCPGRSAGALSRDGGWALVAGPRIELWRVDDCTLHSSFGPAAQLGELRWASAGRLAATWEQASCSWVVWDPWTAERIGAWAADEASGEGTLELKDATLPLEGAALRAFVEFHAQRRLGPDGRIEIAAREFSGG